MLIASNRLRKLKNTFTVSDPLQTCCVPSDLFIGQEDPSIRQTILDIPATDTSHPLPLEEESTKRSHFSLTDPSTSSKPSSDPTLFLENPPANTSEPPSETPAVGALDYPESEEFKHVMSVSFDDRKHERKWTAVSPRELSLFLAILLESSIDADTSSLPLSMNGIPSPAQREVASDGSLRLGEFRGISRDRLIQIRRTLFFPELAEFVDIIDKYNQTFSSEKGDIPAVAEPEYPRGVVSDFLTRGEVSVSLSQALGYLEFSRVALDETQLAQLRGVRKNHRYPETVLWFIAVLYGNLACRALGGRVENGEFLERLIRGLFWVNVAPLSQVLAEDVHYLVRVQKKDNKQKERRMCSVCSTRDAAVKKRTEFMCIRCNKPFCNSSHCFVEFHMKNELPFYRYMNVENWSVCSHQIIDPFNEFRRQFGRLAQPHKEEPKDSCTRIHCRSQSQFRPGSGHFRRCEVCRSRRSHAMIPVGHHRVGLHQSDLFPFANLLICRLEPVEYDRHRSVRHYWHSGFGVPIGWVYCLFTLQTAFFSLSCTFALASFVCSIIASVEIATMGSDRICRWVRSVMTPRCYHGRLDSSH